MISLQQLPIALAVQQINRLLEFHRIQLYSGTSMTDEFYTDTVQCSLTLKRDVGYTHGNRFYSSWDKGATVSESSTWPCLVKVARRLRGVEDSETVAPNSKTAMVWEVARFSWLTFSPLAALLRRRVD